MIQEAEGQVTLVLRLSTSVTFSAIERDGELTESDALEAAIGSLPFDWLEQAEGEGFTIATPIEGEVTEWQVWDAPKSDKS